MTNIRYASAKYKHKHKEKTNTDSTKTNTDIGTNVCHQSCILYSSLQNIVPNVWNCNSHKNTLLQLWLRAWKRQTNIGTKAKILKKRSSETLHFAGGASCSGQGDSKDRLNWPIECLVRVRARYWKTCKSHGKKTNSARLLCKWKPQIPPGDPFVKETNQRHLDPQRQTHQHRGMKGLW